MSNIVKILWSKLTGHVPTTLVDGRIAINQFDKKLFYPDENGNILSHNLNTRVWSGTGVVAGGAGVVSFTFPSGLFSSAPVITGSIEVASGTAVENLGSVSVIAGKTTSGCSVRASTGRQVGALGGASLANAPNGTVVNIIAIQY